MSKHDDFSSKKSDKGDFKSSDLKSDATTKVDDKVVTPVTAAPDNKGTSGTAAPEGNAADETVRMSPVNPRKPLDKEPVFAPGVGPNPAAENFTHAVPTDHRVPPENVSVEPSAKAAEPEAAKAAAPVPVITPAQAGLSQPHLRPGLDPLPEEDPTPSTVPIPPPGPRRVA